MLKFRRTSQKDKTSQQNERIAHAGLGQKALVGHSDVTRLCISGETCSVTIALAGQQIVEDNELKLKGLTVIASS